MGEPEEDKMYKAIIIACITLAFTTFITILIIVVMCLSKNEKDKKNIAQVVPLRDYTPAPTTARDENIDFSPAPTSNAKIEKKDA